MGDNVQNHVTVTSPLFFIGSSPSQADKIINPDYPADGVMISVNSLRKRKSNFKVGNWILDSGAFTEISRHGYYRHSVEEYYYQICRWSRCGTLLRAVAQDYMCEEFVLKRTGLTIYEHQLLTIKRYEQLTFLNPPVRILPVIQGYAVSDYIKHLLMYDEKLSLGEWVGVGSVCKRNGNPEIIRDILRGIKLIRPDLNLHGFGLKQLALENKGVRELLYSCDSMAWSYPKRFGAKEDLLSLASTYQQTIHEAVNDSVQKRIPRTAGAGNGQGRRSKWKSGKTVVIRVPEQFSKELLQLARKWDDDR